jgi:predicted amidophosphoribosyltransferase
MEQVERQIPCPYCGALNSEGSNICGRCMRDIREVANPERRDIEPTSKVINPVKRAGLLRQIIRWWKFRTRR